MKDEVFAAMTALGYNDKQVGRAIDRVAGEMTDDASVETWIRTILQVI
ncbi:MAG: RuvA C-terminal domain-containing protein [Chitinispirillaceae bacterium]|nr:RuvA C-terminal domain-containing protein [Chitinispirillaceae bacterium]